MAPFWAPLIHRCLTIIGTQKGTIILTTTHIRDALNFSGGSHGIESAIMRIYGTSFACLCMLTWVQFPQAPGCWWDLGFVCGCKIQALSGCLGSLGLGWWGLFGFRASGLGFRGWERGLARCGLLSSTPNHGAINPNPKPLPQTASNPPSPIPSTQA